MTVNWVLYDSAYMVDNFVKMYKNAFIPSLTTHFTVMHQTKSWGVVCFVYRTAALSGVLL